MILRTKDGRLDLEDDGSDLLFGEVNGMRWPIGLADVNRDFEGKAVSLKLVKRFEVNPVVYDVWDGALPDALDTL